jgi:phage gp29-like protein
MPKADPKLRAIRVDRLTKEQARPMVGTALTSWRESVADNLTPARLGRLIRDADTGDSSAYLILAEEMEEREPHYASVLNTRKLGVSGSMRVVTSPDDSADAKAITEDVELLVGRPEFEGLVLDLMDGVAKGFACVEIMWSRDVNRWEPTGYEFRPQRHFVFDRDTLSVPRLRSLEAPTEGVPLDPYKWLCHMPKIRSGIPLRTGLARTVAVTYAAKRWTVADWMSFLDIYGVPIRIGRYPSAMADKKRLLLRAVQSLGADAAAVIPEEMSVEILESKASGAGSTLFQQSAEYWDKQTSKVVLGQTMTSDDGSSLAQSKTHERVRFDIRAADARAVAATINRDLIKPYVDLNYGIQDAYPEFSILCEEPEDTKSLMESVRIFVNLGGRVQESEIRDRLGLAEPEEGADVLLPEKLVGAAEAGEPGEDPADTDTDDVVDEGSAEPGDEIGSDDTGQVSELNREGSSGHRETFAAAPETEDAVDALAEARLAEWRPLVSENVGRLLQAIQNARTYEEARALLEELARDEGDVLDVGALVVSLARATFTVRGIGDATDSVDKP